MSCISVHSTGIQCALPATHTLEGIGFHAGGGIKWAAGGMVSKTEEQLTRPDSPNQVIVHPENVWVAHDHNGEIVGYVVTL